MAIVKPFKGIRPAADKVHLVTSRSVDHYGQEEIRQKLDTNPYSFLHVIKPDVPVGSNIKHGSNEYLKHIKKEYTRFISDKTLVQDKSEAFYIYQQIKKDVTFTGIIGCASIDDYFNQVIKIHEQTLTDREDKLKTYLETCDFNAEPVCMSYPDNIKINHLITSIIQNNTPTYHFTTTDTVQHKIWVVDSKEDINTICAQFENIPAIYIADGHHRTASSALLGKSKREELSSYTGKEGFNYFMCIFFPESQLKIVDFNRVVKDLNGLSENDLLNKLAENFTVEKKGASVYKPTQLHNFSMYLNHKWYSLTANKTIRDDSNPVGILDASILTKHILNPLLGIEDLKTSKRIYFISGIKGMETLQKEVDSEKAKVAFGLYPATMKQVKDIADAHQSMPPKTTWVEPKLRSGLVIFSLADNLS